MTAAQQATVKSMTEEEFAIFIRTRGTHVTSKKGRFWRSDLGRFQPTHLYARLSSSEIVRPAPNCWAYRAALADGNEGAANGAIPMHLIQDLDSFSLERVRPSKRRQIRASLQNLTFVEIVEPELLEKQGLRVLKSAVERHGYGRLHGQTSYRKSIDPFFTPQRGLALGALRGEELVGYITMYAVTGTAYVDEVHLASDALDTHVGPGLLYQVVEACKRSPEVTKLVHGLVAPERPGLATFKEQMGFRTVEVPARYWIAPGAKQLLRSLRLPAYYRFTGQQSDPSRQAQSTFL